MESSQFTREKNAEYTLQGVQAGDSATVAQIVNEMSQRLQGFNETWPADVAGFWQTPGVNLAEDTRLLLDENGQPCGYAEALTIEDPPAHPYIYFRARPNCIADGSAAILFDWAVEHCSQALVRVPEDLRVAISAHNFGGYEPLQKMFESRGFELIRHSFRMSIEIKAQPKPAQWPSGIQLKPLDAEVDAAAIYRAHDEAFSDHFGHQDQPFEVGFARFRHMMIEDNDGFDPDLWFVAVDGDQIAGYSICRLNPQEDPPIGWVNILGVRRPWRKRGLGMALLLHSFGEFYRRGLRKAGLGVDASNLTGALRLYERAGMQVAHRYDRYEKELRPGKELMTTELSE